MKLYLQLNSKLLISSVVFLLSSAECEISHAYEYKNADISWHLHIYQQRKFRAELSLTQTKFYHLGLGSSVHRLLSIFF